MINDYNYLLRKYWKEIRIGHRICLIYSPNKSTVKNNDKDKFLKKYSDKKL